MLKQTILALASLTTLSIAIVPVTTGSALAQRCSTVQCPDNKPGEGDTYECTDQLGHLRRVYEDDLDEITNPNHVSIMPVCIGEDYGIFRSDGNAGALRAAIADNGAMMEALFLKNFGDEDVIGVRLTAEDKVILYVHPFHHY